MFQKNHFIQANIAPNELMRFVVLGLIASILMSLVFQSQAHAGVTGVEFKGLYDFVYGAATGYLGRAICIFAGIVGIASGAALGKAIPAIIGVVLAVFGTLGPVIVNSLFKSATI